MEHSGFEPLTPTLPVLCATSCANAPYESLCRNRGLRGAYWTRTSDPIDVNDVLYQLSQSTICAAGFRLTTKYILAEVFPFVKHYFS